MRVLAVIARPYTWWQLGLIGAMGLGFLLVLTVPWLPLGGSPLSGVSLWSIHRERVADA